jgi:hypothetical protein
MNIDALTALIAQWETLASEAKARLQHDHVGDTFTRYHYQAVMATYRRAAADLREVITDPAQSAAPPPAPTDYIPMTTETAATLLRSAGLHTREIYVHKDGAVTAVFPRLQPDTQDARAERLLRADDRMMILAVGKLPDTGDPYIDFALLDVTVAEGRL